MNTSSTLQCKCRDVGGVSLKSTPFFLVQERVLENLLSKINREGPMTKLQINRFREKWRKWAACTSMQEEDYDALEELLIIANWEAPYVEGNMVALHKIVERIEG